MASLVNGIEPKLCSQLQHTVYLYTCDDLDLHCVQNSAGTIRTSSTSSSYGNLQFYAILFCGNCLKEAKKQVSGATGCFVRTLLESHQWKADKCLSNVLLLLAPSCQIFHRTIWPCWSAWWPITATPHLPLTPHPKPHLTSSLTQGTTWDFFFTTHNIIKCTLADTLPHTNLQ